MYLTGGIAEHIVALMRNESGVLYALESTSSMGRSGQYNKVRLEHVATCILTSSSPSLSGTPIINQCSAQMNPNV